MTTKAEFLEKILSINSKYNTELIGKAFDTAQRLHAGQLRKSGEPYFIHPIHVALILAEMGMDDATIVGGLLHDVVEDTPYTREQLVTDFGEEIALLVDGVTKLGTIKFESKEEIQAENFRKMFLAMSKDIRVLIIKLADRLHNMRTMEYMSPEKKIEKCNETLEIYAPLASRLGISKVKFELEDLALKYLHPQEFQELKEKVNKRKEEREATINLVISEIRDSLDDMHLHYDIYGRAKHYYSIYKKMKYQNKQIDEIFDLIAVRIIVDNVKDCYAVLGIVHTMWKPIPGRFKDYIAMPKPKICTNPCIRRSSATTANRLKFRSAPMRCIRSRNTVSQHTGSTRKEILPAKHPMTISNWHGCGSLWNGSRTSMTRRTSWRR